MGSYKLINHTADIGISVEGEDLKDLFSTAACAMFSQIIDLKRIHKRDERRIKIDGENPEDLLIRWLNELLFLLEGGFVPRKFQIEKIENNHLSAKLMGEEVDFSHFPLKQEIKAATYHQLEIKKVDTRYKTTIIFDV